MGAIYATSRLFIAIALVVLIYVLIFTFKWPIIAGHGFLFFLTVTCILDYIVLRKASHHIEAIRIVGDQLSLSDHQLIEYIIENGSNSNLEMTLIDELPMQLQHRDFLYKTIIPAGKKYSKKHKIRPTLRGAYVFGKLHVYINKEKYKLLEVRCSFDLEKEVKVYPSFMQMKEYDLQIFNKVAVMHGLKKVRRIGRTDEFEHIKNFTQGDPIKTINWKATSRRGELMINQYQDTRSQSVYCIIDKGRSMKMPFKKLSLLDYAVNSTFVLSNIILKKYDKAGLISFNDQIGTIVKSDNLTGQLSKISQTLYNEQTGFKESNYQALFYHIRKKITRRSVLILFSNFEHKYDMRRALPYLRQLNKIHLVVVIFFTNTELIEESSKKIETLTDIYATTFAKKTLIEKELIGEELRKYGIQTILSTPDELSINVINKYLEIKAKRMV